MSLDGCLELKLLNSLIKVFADEEPKGGLWDKGSMLVNEVYSFQVAYCWSGKLKKNVQIRVNSELSPWITVRKVGLIASEMPCYADHDENVLRTTPGLYPDILMPLDDEGLALLPGQWRSLWFQINPEGNIESGIYPIEIELYGQSEGILGKVVFHLEVINALLPKQKLVHTEWFHSDCIATYYGIDVFSEEYWNRIEQFVNTAVKHGMNMILTPIFTPPLDTAVGGERPTVQLVDVYKSQDSYSFGFEKLNRWVDLCRKCGMEFFEFSHMFTQWGAKHAPKIMAYEDGKLVRIFGWDTDAGGEAYKSFLSQFLPELVRFLKQNNMENQSYFHVSDEPFIEHFDDYKKASSIIYEYLKEYPVIDALSDYTFYEAGVVKKPIPASNHIEAFLENNVPDLWTYFCCSQYKKVANRFFNMPSARSRIFGIQLYKYNIRGFLHWGYNFWYSVYSKHPIDPYRVTDAEYAFPSGDAFVVYPGKDGPLESLRLEVFNEALQDLRALELLETLVGRESVVKILEDGLDYPISFKEYPRHAEWILLKREQINKMIADIGC